MPAQDNVFLDVLMREANTKRGGSIGRGGWGVALPRAALEWFARRPGAPPGSAASALSKVLKYSPPARYTHANEPYR